MSHEGHFAVLDPDECKQLVCSGGVGRVGWSAGEAGQLVLPVNYTVIDDLIVFRTASRSVLAQLADGHQVAFQVDEYDDEAANGWSVLIQGRTQLFGDERIDSVPTPWALGMRHLVIAVVPHNYSGRAVSAGD